MSKFPALPKTLQGPAGPIAIQRKTPIKSGDVECWGLWNDATRVIQIDTSATPAHQWKVLFHELTHVAMDDSGLSNGMSDELVEAICDAVSTQRFRERFG